ncbi:MAG: nucleotidyl transferase AbiEii/AbiGii toxin family protein [Bdellovibrionales bacterium]
MELKALNSRMKDYFDCYVLIKQNVMNIDKVKMALKNTFEQRHTELAPVEDYSVVLEQPWQAFARKVENTPVSLSDIISTINNYISDHKLKIKFIVK